MTVAAISTRPAAEGEPWARDQAEIAADAADADTPERYPAGEVAAAVGLDPKELPGKRLTARVGAGHRLEDRLA